MIVADLNHAIGWSVLGLVVGGLLLLLYTAVLQVREDRTDASKLNAASDLTQSHVELYLGNGKFMMSDGTMVVGGRHMAVNPHRRLKPRVPVRAYESDALSALRVMGRQIDAIEWTTPDPDLAAWIYRLASYQRRKDRQDAQ